MVALPLVRYRAVFAAEEPVHLPSFAGSSWRGAFGTALKRTVCATRLRDCGPCPLVGSCCFPYLFEGRRPQDAPVLSSLDRLPVPYLFQPPAAEPARLEPGDVAVLDFTLVGAANARLIYVVHAISEAAAHGVGRGRGRLSLRRIDRLAGIEGPATAPVFDGDSFLAAPPAEPPPLTLQGTRRLQLRLRSPLRLKVDGRLVRPEALHPHHLVDAAVRRVSALAAVHAAAPVEADYRGLKALAQRLEFSDARFRWTDWMRRSSRQQQTMAMGGVCRTSTLLSGQRQPSWPVGLAAADGFRSIYVLCVSPFSS